MNNYQWKRAKLIIAHCSLMTLPTIGDAAMTVKVTGWIVCINRHSTGTLDEMRAIEHPWEECAVNGLRRGILPLVLLLAGALLLSGCSLLPGSDPTDTPTSEARALGASSQALENAF